MFWYHGMSSFIPRFQLRSSDAGRESYYLTLAFTKREKSQVCFPRMCMFDHMIPHNFAQTFILWQFFFAWRQLFYKTTNLPFFSFILNSLHRSGRRKGCKSPPQGCKWRERPYFPLPLSHFNGKSGFVYTSLMEPLSHFRATPRGKMVTLILYFCSLDNMELFDAFHSFLSKIIFLLPSGFIFPPFLRKSPY